MCIQRTIAITIVIGGDRSALRRIGNRSWPNAWGTGGCAAGLPLCDGQC